MHHTLVCTLLVSVTLFGLQTEAWCCCNCAGEVTKANDRCEREKKALKTEFDRQIKNCGIEKVKEANARCEKEKEALTVEATSRCEKEKDALRGEATAKCEKEKDALRGEATAKCEEEKKTLKADFTRQSSNKLRILARQLSDCLKKPDSGTCSADKCFWDLVIEKCIPKELAL
ncbi:uncharacterized protein LOC134256365 [Saccostrea cucullata]|uniref:uncharacterized protein LOC134256365 n=1 Tax=Saccostrea cuccullata TaxID=36930 RepID=UPI002ED690C1